MLREGFKLEKKIKKVKKLFNKVGVGEKINWLLTIKKGGWIGIKD